LEGLKKAIPGNAYNKLAAIAEKLKKGEALNKTEQDLWSGVDQAAGGSGAPVTPPVAPAPAADPSVTFSDIDPTGGLVIPEVKPEQPELKIEPVKATPEPVEIKPAKPEIISADPVKIPSVREEVPATLKDKFVGPAREPARQRLAAAAESAKTAPNAAALAVALNPEGASKIVYEGAKEDGSKAAQDEQRRRAEVDKARNDPSLREPAAKWGEVAKNVSGTQVILWSGENVLVHAGRLLDHAVALGAEKLIPYPMA
jgi:hypothetical protein